jgi:transketolase
VPSAGTSRPSKNAWCGYDFRYFRAWDRYWIRLALAARFSKSPSRTYVIIGDGESQGGIVWEGAMTAAKYRLSNLTVILDYNDVQLDGAVHEIMPLEPVVDKWKAFNWAVIEINGHDMRQVLEASRYSE